MKLIIDIPDETYKAIMEKYDTFPVQMKELGLKAIKYGTLLSRGHWIVEENEHYGIYTTECGICHAVFQFAKGFKFCPACGSRMES